MKFIIDLNIQPFSFTIMQLVGETITCFLYC